MAKVSDAFVERALARIVASDREEDAAKAVASALDTFASDFTRWRGGDRRNMTASLAVHRPGLVIPAPVEYVDAGIPAIREFIDRVERAAADLVLQLTGQLGYDHPDPEGASWWRCRWCGHVDTEVGRPVDREQAECLAHEVKCGRRAG